MSPNQPEPPAAPDPLGDGQDLFLCFSRRLIGLAKAHLGGRLQHRVDPEDIVQSAYKSFLIRYGDAPLEADGWESLWGLLTLITIRKCADRARYYAADCRAVDREVSTPASDDGSTAWIEAAGREPTPDEAALLAETVADLLRRLDSDERAIVELSLQGYSTQEISAQTGRAERSVRRLRERVRKQLEDQQAETAS